LLRIILCVVHKYTKNKTFELAPSLSFPMQERVKNVQISSTNCAMFTCTLHPNDSSPPDDSVNANEQDSSISGQHAAAGYIELTPQKLIEAHQKLNKRNVLLGNDLFYSSLFDATAQDNNGEGGRFKLRIVISKANEGVSCKKFHDGLFDLLNERLLVVEQAPSSTATNEHGNEMNNNNSSNDEYGSGITEEMVEGNETLLWLKQQVVDARIVNEEYKNTISGGGNNYNSSSRRRKSGEYQTESSKPIVGYYVTIMLCEPHIQKDDIVIPPPSYLDKCDVNFKPVPYPNNEDDDAACYNGGMGEDTDDEGRGVFSGKNNICTSLQFINPGPWERANLQAFELIALDVKKALVRVEFPMFPEGCREKTFREVYQLNARVSDVVLFMFLSMVLVPLHFFPLDCYFFFFAHY